MEEALTISKEAPEQKSMNYALLRDEGIKYIQRIAGKIWSDYNIHDPGVTILEAVSYAITDLGYRTSYHVKDILARNPDDPHAKEIHNFFTARRILHNAPVTINDFRKLLIDVEVESTISAGCESVGVKNAWIEKAAAPEVQVYVDKNNSQLVLDPVDPGQKPLDLRILYDVLLEFGKCEKFGDLNDNKIVKDLTIANFPAEPELTGLVIRVDVQFPRWDDADVDWNDDGDIKDAIIAIEVTFINLPDNFTITPSVTDGNDVILHGSKDGVSGPEPIAGINDLSLQINDFIYTAASSLLLDYKNKIAKIGEILTAVKATLHANRSLCEDFVNFHALRIEEILLCTDIELAADAKVETVQAHVYHEIAKFLSPTVFFYSLNEMLTDCHEAARHSVISVNTAQNTITVSDAVEIEKGGVVTISGSNNNNGQYTVTSIRTNKDNQTYTDITVEQSIPSGIVTEGEYLFAGESVEECTSVEHIFEGPRLKHGFIKGDELEKADRKKVIHVSDLIQIIMDVPGVLAVRNIQIANKPQDNEDGSIESKSVKWCLHLAFDQNYVPRLNTDDSRITFYKDQLPFKARQLEVEQLIKDLEAKEQKQKRENLMTEFLPPVGEYKDIESYTSILNEFPMVYGVGKEGLPEPSDFTPDEAQARQLKGYLMFFDQLLANYLSQLAHVNDLFSMNAARDEFGDFVIGRTYYTQPLFNTADASGLFDGLYVDKPGHAEALNEIAETEQQFGERRNRFLDHLMARFAEQFTDYALLTYRLSGEKAPLDLIEDKLSFLNAYPTISEERGKGFNYKSPCSLWSTGNVSGLEKRVSMLLGIEERKADRLHFSPRFKITGTTAPFGFLVENDVPVNVLESISTFDAIDQAKAAIEEMVASGVLRDNYRIVTDDGVNFYFELCCGEKILARSVIKNFVNDQPGGDADLAVEESLALIAAEFYGNLESNRNNLGCTLFNYFKYTITLDMVADPPTFTVAYDLYKEPFLFAVPDKVLTGAYTATGEAKTQVNVTSVDVATSTISVTGNITGRLAPGDKIVIDQSAGNDGAYTIDGFSFNGTDTEIVVIEAIPSAAAPLGVVRYNQVTSAEMQEFAESATADVAWKLVANGVKRERYRFNPAFPPYTSPYKFEIRDYAGTTFGESVAYDFNAQAADWISHIATNKIVLAGTVANDGEYTVVSAADDGPNVEVKVSPAPPVAAAAGGELSFSETYTLGSVDVALRTFGIALDLTSKLVPGDTISIIDSPSNDGDYRITGISYDGSETTISVHEHIASADHTGKMKYTRAFPVVSVSGDVVTVKGGLDDKAVTDIIALLTRKFFDHEGMHVVEHILLRPKVNEMLFVETVENTLDDTLAAFGTLTFDKKFPVSSADSVTQTFKIAADIVADLPVGKRIRITDTTLLNGEYTVLSAVLNGTDTDIVVDESFIADIAPASGEGELLYSITVPVTSVEASTQKIVIGGNHASAVETGSILTVAASQGHINDGRYTLLIAADVAATTELVVDQVEELVQDRLLAINLDEDCDCSLEDMYSCIAHVILPYWPGRFINKDYRKFMERTLRMEAPAHVFLCICWVNCRHITEFERSYKAWLVANARSEPDKVELSATLDKLIDSIEKLRNVYPTGTLHDCDEDENLDNAIILDNSALGEI